MALPSAVHLAIHPVTFKFLYYTATGADLTSAVLFFQRLMPFSNDIIRQYRSNGKSLRFISVPRIGNHALAVSLVVFPLSVVDISFCLQERLNTLNRPNSLASWAVKKASFLLLKFIHNKAANHGQRSQSWRPAYL